MLTRNFYRPFLMGLALCMVTILAVGCDSPDNPSDPVVKNQGDKEQRQVLAMDDTTLLNSLGQWHNDIMDQQLAYIGSLDSITRRRIGTEEPFSHDQIILRIHAQMSANPEFTPTDLEIPDSRLRYTPIFGRRAETTPASDWRFYVDSVRLSYGMAPFYIDVYDAVANIFLNSPSPNIEFENYLRGQLARPYTDDEKNYIRMLVSIGRKSREYWDTHPLLAAHRGDAMGKSSRVAIPAWAAGDIAGAACGGISSIFSDWWNDKPIDWGHAAGQAIIWGAGGSLLPAAVAKFKLK